MADTFGIDHSRRRFIDIRIVLAPPHPVERVNFPQRGPRRLFAADGIGTPHVLICQPQCVGLVNSIIATAMPSGFEALLDSGVRSRVPNGTHFAARDESELKRCRASS
jgi:hypothetical protein